MISLAQLFAPSTRAEVEQSILNAAAALGFPVAAWQSGGVARSIVAAVSQKIADLTQVVSLVAKGGLLDTATGSWLTLLAAQVFNVERQPAAAATYQETLTNSTAAILGPFAAGALRVARSSSPGKTYRLLDDGVSVPALGSTTATFIAEEVGTASNAAPGVVTVLVTSVLGLTVTNAGAVVGVDEETDAALRARCRLKLGALSPNGAAAAYEYVALTSSLNGGVTVTRAKVVGDKATGTVTVTLANASGGVSGGEVTLVDSALEAQVVPVAVTLVTQAATDVSVAVTVNVWIYTSAGLDVSAVQGLVSAKLVEHFAAQKIGGDYVSPGPGQLYVDGIVAAARSASPFIFHATLTTPVVDTPLATDEVAVLGAVLVNVTEVAPP